MSTNRCQIHNLPQMAEPIPIVEKIWQRRNRAKRIVKRRWRYLINLFSEITKLNTKASEELTVKTYSTVLKPGDMVRIRSREEIRQTLNHFNQLNHCSFMEEMWPYCGITQRVLKRVENFLDERDYLIKKCKGIVILDGVTCQGTKDFGDCDRSCFFFWREEWLEKLSKE